MILKGYKGKILAVDLTAGKVTVDPLTDELAERFVGGRGLATQLFMERVDPRVDPLSPGNAIVIATSPMVGTQAITAGRGHMVFKSPLTGFIGSSNSGGDWAVFLKRAGFDAVILTGRAAKPTLIRIDESGVRILDASDLWGKDVHETTSMIEARETVPCRVLCIGTAGEKQSRFSDVLNERNRAYGRGGTGAVFGSKNLKAIVVSGKDETTVQSPDKFQSILEQIRHCLRAVPVTKRILRDLGTAGLVKLINQMDMLPHNNFRDTVHDPKDLDGMCGEAIAEKILVKSGGCFHCPIACQRHTKVGGVSGEGPEFETLVLMGPLCGIYDLEAVTRANYLCNRFGLDTMTYGGTMAAAMELYEIGAITSKDTGGIELKFGNAKALEELVEPTALRQGFGEILSEGSYRLAEHFGHPELSMSVKKLEIAAYDPRASFAQALGYMTSPTGACHLRGGYSVSYAFFAGAKEVPRFSIRRAPGTVRMVQNVGILQDSLGICRFTGFAIGMEMWARLLSATTGGAFSTDKLDGIAETVATMERRFNVGAGLTSKDDTLPPRFLNEGIKIGGEVVRLTAQNAEKMKADYYYLRGWGARAT
jgi:aldehyde:ferredoxin oxidoreductase